MQNTAVIRRVNGELVWYPPGASEGAHFLRTDEEQQALRVAIAERAITPVFAVPGEEARLLRLTVSAQERRHIKNSLPFMLEDELTEDIDELHFSAAPINAEEYAVAVCSNENMQSYADLLEPYPQVSRWLPEPLLLPWREGEWCLLLEGEHAVLRYSQCEGFSIERDMVPALLAATLVSSEEPEAVVVYGQQQAEDIALLPQALQARAQWRQGDLYSAMLLADNPSPVLNLRQGEYIQRLPLKRWWQQWKVAAIVFAVALLTHSISSYMQYRQLQQQNLALRSAVQESYREAFPRGAIVDAEKQLKRQLDALTGDTQSSGFVTLMESVGQVVHGSAGTSIVSINYNDKADEMRLNIVANDYGAVEQVRSALNELGLNAVMENSSAQGEKVRARLRVGGRA